MVRPLRGLAVPALVLACFLASCRSSGDGGSVAHARDGNVGDDGPTGAQARGNTPLRPNDAGQVRSIGATCRPEDGWQYDWPAPPEAPDGGGPHTVPIPPDYTETHQLQPGIGYCRQGTYEGGFFTSNCVTASDCARSPL
jgi:hypothetical protein